MRGLRVALVIGLCAIGCAKRSGEGTSAPDHAAAAQPEAGKDMTAPEEAEARTLDTQLGDVTPQAEAPQSLEDLSAALDRHEAELRAEGVRLATHRRDEAEHAKRPASPTKPSSGAVASKKIEDPCPRICAIATAVCELKVKICALADEHDDEPRYAATCKRATTDCSRATEACDACG